MVQMSFQSLSLKHRKSLVKVLLVFSSLLSFHNADAYPEFAGDGYASCSTCHVGTSGGDTLMPYGRSVAEEKLTWKSYEGEAQPLHGLVKLPKWLIVGGRYRRLQTNIESAQLKEGRHFAMQRELDFGLKVKMFTGVVVISNERKVKDPYEFDDRHSLVPRWTLRGDISENVIVRVGRFMPKFGLGVPDHNAFVRLYTGLGMNPERRLVEATYLNEWMEGTLSSYAGFLPESKADRGDKASKLQNALYGNFSVFLKEKHRLNASVQRREKKDNTVSHYGASFVTTPFDSFRILGEMNAGIDKTKGLEATKSISQYLKFWFKPHQGFYPSIVYERRTQSNPDAGDTLDDRIATGLSVHPRPHVELVGTLATQRDLKSFTFINTANFIIHYWL